MEIEMDRIGPAIIACLLILAGIFYVYALTTLHQRIDHAAKAKALLTQQDLAKRKADPARKEQRPHRPGDQGLALSRAEALS